MLLFNNTDVWGFDHAVRGMRMPMNGAEKSDTESGEIGMSDMDLGQRLIVAGSEHRKFLRQVMVSVDITAPLYWWKEFDTYKIGTTANSQSTMHKLATTPITRECFELADDIDFEIYVGQNAAIAQCESLRQKYLETKDNKYWKALIQLLPCAWLQTRTVTMNYENLRNIYMQRRHHKLSEWSVDFMKWIDTLPYSKKLIKYEKEITQ